MLEQTIAGVRSRRLNPLQAAKEADAIIGGITAVIYKPGRKLTLQNHTKRISIAWQGMSAREEERVGEFATLAYWLAQQHGCWQAGEVHLGRGLSSKHYAGAFRGYTQQLLAKYN